MQKLGGGWEESGTRAGQGRAGKGGAEQRIARYRCQSVGTERKESKGMRVKWEVQGDMNATLNMSCTYNIRTTLEISKEKWRGPGASLIGGKKARGAYRNRTRIRSNTNKAVRKPSRSVSHRVCVRKEGRIEKR